ncbi:MAG: tetratricopeptide repeat protein, partial [Chthoniobacterales bacterium]
KAEESEPAAPEEKAASKTLFRKSMGADAVLFRKNKGDDSDSSASSAQQESPVSETEISSEASAEDEADDSTPRMDLTQRISARLFLAVATGILLLFGFLIGRCSAPHNNVAFSAEGKKPIAHVEWVEKFRDALLALKQGNTTKAGTIAAELAALKQSDTYYPAGWIYTQLKDSDNAMANLDKVAPQNIHASDAAILQGILALKTSGRSTMLPKAHNAEAFFQKAISIDPLNVEAHVLYGAFLRAQGRNQSAVDQLKDATLYSRSADSAFVYQILLRLAENDLDGPAVEAPKNPDTADQIVAAVNIWRKGGKEESVTLLKNTLHSLPASVQRTLVQDPAFRELPGAAASTTPVSTPTPTPAPVQNQKETPAGNPRK